MFYGDEEANTKKWKEITDYIATATEPIETIQERIEKLKNKK